MNLSRKEQGALIAVILLIVAGLAYRGLSRPGDEAALPAPGGGAWAPLGQLEARLGGNVIKPTGDQAAPAVANATASPAAGGGAAGTASAGNAVPADAASLNASASGEGLDINAASEEDFQHLSGIGPAKAVAIVAARRAKGRFSSVDDLMNVPGIGPKTLDKLRPSLRVASSSETNATAAADAAPISNAAGSPVPTAPPAAARATQPNGLVDLNSADAAALETLPGIGPAKSAAILATRAKLGAFATVDDLTKTPGIGDKTLERLRPLVTVTGAPATKAVSAANIPTAAPGAKLTPVAEAEAEPVRVGQVEDKTPLAAVPGQIIDINRAPLSELERLPGIGRTLAARIVAYRSAHGRFRYIGELEKVNGIGPKKLRDLRDLVKCGP